MIGLVRSSCKYEKVIRNDSLAHAMQACGREEAQLHSLLNSAWIEVIGQLMYSAA